MTDHGYRIGLEFGDSPVAKAIQWQTRSAYNHAKFLAPSGFVIEATITGMGRRRRHSEPRTTWFDVAFGLSPTPLGCVPDYESLPLEGWQTAESFLRDTVRRGTDYSFWNVLSFITKAARLESRRLDCSQAIFAAIRLGGVELLSRVSEGFVSPAMLSTSPLRIELPLP